GIKTTTITYAGSTSGTTAPNSGWTTTVPTVAAGNYLWTKTVWGYTDNTSETGYSVAMMGVKGDRGDRGERGLQGADGTNGDPGKIVSDTEPTTRFKGLTWKYSGNVDKTASDGTVIHPNTEYYYNGTHWMINYLSANNLEANSITADLIDAKNLKITDGEFVSTIINGSVKTQTEIKDDHLLIYKMDTSHNEIHTIALKSDSG
ncbi:collagen-like triple helix repeat-containing protein, partial [Lactococcus lactis]|uniref:collagen-like triple helix repeat-containing protein n=1 Tax=Lactococcus lactis TaxID=1358 RepID=UPI00223B28AC